MVTSTLQKGGLREVKKRFMSVAIASLLIISMCIPVSAKRVFVQTSPSGGGYWAVVPDNNDSSSSSSSGSSSSSSSSSNSGSGQSAKEPVFTTPTGQPITDSLITLLAASQSSTGAVAPVSKTTIIAYSNFIRAIGLNAALVTAFVPSGKEGNDTVSNGLIVKGLSYTVMVQRPTGQVEFVNPTNVENGKLTYKKPAGPIASIAIVCNAVAPK